MTVKSSNQSQSSSKVDYNVHVIIPDGDSDRIGPKLGVAFNNKSGNGFSIILNAYPIPINGKVKLVALKPTPQS